MTQTEPTVFPALKHTHTAQITACPPAVTELPSPGRKPLQAHISEADPQLINHPTVISSNAYQAARQVPAGLKQHAPPSHATAHHVSPPVQLPPDPRRVGVAHGLAVEHGALAFVLVLAALVAGDVRSSWTEKEQGYREDTQSPIPYPPQHSTEQHSTAQCG